jgi:transposase
MLARIDALSLDIADLDTKIEARLAPSRTRVTRLDEIPGVGATTAAVIIAAAPAILLPGFAILVVGFTPRWTSTLATH